MCVAQTGGQSSTPALPPPPMGDYNKMTPQQQDTFKKSAPFFQQSAASVIR